MQCKIFNNLLTALWTVSNTYAQVARWNCGQITYNTSDTHHVQHMSHVVQMDSSASKPDSLHSFYLRFILLAEQSTDEGGKETGVPRENPRQHASENATIY